jgi:diguanylate cyclase (GGDEF)-like protein
MQIHSSSLTLSAPQATCQNVVPVGMTLEQVVDRVRLDGPGHILVVHEDGALAGVITTEELLLRMSAADGVERLKWSRRPIESILSAVITPNAAVPLPPAPAIPAAVPWPCTAYFHHGRLQAVTTDDDVLLSWRSIEPFLLGAARDGVTGLITRTAFLRSFECELARARRSHKPLSIVLIDIDYFKQINDRAGHAAGDIVLSLIAGAICTSVRSYDIVARFAGDEFVALCCECVPDQVHIPVSRMQQAVASLPYPVEFPLERVTLSLGVASVSAVTAGITCEALLEAADDCLYTAKRNGRDQAYAVILDDPARSSPRPVCVEGPVDNQPVSPNSLDRREKRGRRSDSPDPLLFPLV